MVPILTILDDEQTPPLPPPPPKKKKKQKKTPPPPPPPQKKSNPTAKQCHCQNHLELEKRCEKYNITNR